MGFKILKGIDQGIDKISLNVLVIGIWGMLLLSLATIVLRWFQITFLWIDPLVRHLVFLSAFLGGVVATGKGQHIGMDFISKLLEQKGKVGWQHLIDRTIYTVSLLTLIWLTIGSLKFVDDTFLYEKKPVFLGIHGGYLVSIIPLGFILMAYRFFFQLVKSFVEPEKSKMGEL